MQYCYHQKAKKACFFLLTLSLFNSPESPTNLCFSSQVAGALIYRNLKPDKIMGLKSKFLFQGHNSWMSHQVIIYSQLIF